LVSPFDVANFSRQFYVFTWVSFAIWTEFYLVMVVKLPRLLIIYAENEPLF
jgi:hypothetical protein